MEEIICTNCGKNQIKNKFGYCSFCLKKIDDYQRLELEKTLEKSLEKRELPDSKSEHFKRSRELLALLSRKSLFLDVRDNGEILSIKVKKKKRIIFNLVKLFIGILFLQLIFLKFQIIDLDVMKVFSLVYFLIATFLFLQYAFFQKNLIINTKNQTYKVFNAFSNIEGECSELSVGTKKTRTDRTIYFEVVLKKYGQQIFTFFTSKIAEDCYGGSAIIAHILEIEYDKTINELPEIETRKGFFYD